MSELTDFLLTQIAADEEWARWAGAAQDAERSTGLAYVSSLASSSVTSAARVLAECAAKREVVRIVGRLGGHYEPDAGRQAPGILRALANIYAGVDGWREEWA